MDAARLADAPHPAALDSQTACNRRWLKVSVALR